MKQFVKRLRRRPYNKYIIVDDINSPGHSRSAFTVENRKVLKQHSCVQKPRRSSFIQITM